MGSWAEYLYSEVMQGNFSCSIQTRDIDFLYRNINKPNDPVPIIASLEADGYLYAEDFITGVSKFRYQDIIEIEFLTTALGSGHQKTQKISPLNITGESMRVLNILNIAPREIEYNHFKLYVPEPAVFIIQKIIANPTRTPIWKKSKDIETCKRLLIAIKNDSEQCNIFNYYIEHYLSKKEKNIFNQIITENNLYDVQEILETNKEIGDE